MIEFELPTGYDEYVLEFSNIPQELYLKICRANGLPITVRREDIKTGRF